ncbi:protein C2-DOMAIN ABA-RELATED 5-like [Canna indica]|uniref:Protein C2-DOMAIN ABA-RELATED 5-like n=1 Tax=Canna indica TaxID=4628 RepID=A0AAQ3KA97_9LILI|nr:protein C2-DOMAIN ABA-RELATED 5-like [Canna indica]
MENVLGLLRVRVVKGINLAFRDANGSDPYVVLRMSGQKLKTSVKKNNVNPVWNEDLTLTVSEPIEPLKLQVYDKDTFSRDDKMGDAEIDIQPFIEAVKLNLSPDVPSDTIVTTVKPNRQNCLADESAVVWKDCKIVQDIIVRLRNVESGELELQLLWIKIPGAQGF